MEKYSKTWWKDTADRVVSTIAQSAIATLSIGLTGLLDIDPIAVLSIAGLAGLISLLKAIALTNKQPQL